MTSIARAAAHRSKLLAAVLLLSGGCGGGDGVTPSPSALPTLSITSDTPTLEARRGSGGAVVVSVLQSDGQTGAVTVQVENAPAGVTSNVTAITSETSARLYRVTFSVTTAATPGTHTVRVRAERDGATAATTPVSITIPELAFVSSPSTVRLWQVGTGSVVYRYYRPTGFRGDVALSIESVPTGVTATVTPATLTGAEETAIVTFVADGSRAEGFYGASVRADAPGQISLTRGVSVNIVSPFSIRTLADAIVVVRGSEGLGVVFETREADFGEVLTYSVSGLPANVTSTIAPGATGPASKLVRLSVGANAPVGTHTITVHAVSSGALPITRTATLSLVIQ